MMYLLCYVMLCFLLEFGYIISNANEDQELFHARFHLIIQLIILI
jgi:hypothetical protein